LTTVNDATLLLDRDGAVLWIRLNRPDARNAIDPDTRDTLKQTLIDADADPEVRAIVITGQGRDFCTGMDLAPPGATGTAVPQGRSPLDYRRSVGPFQALFRTLWELETPVVSAVNGTTAGAGWMLALLADLVVAAEGARWTHVFARRGMVPHAGDPFFLPRVIPFHRLNEIALLSEAITSEQLAEWGLINRLVPPDEVDAAARELANKLAEGPTRSLGLTKKLYRRSLVSDMETAFGEEATATALVSQTKDRAEGVTSLLEGRRANFTGT
jgi:2-(1,2-epoxy-1,2-dihydrophenyl)acetyl-CoA isomerase